MTADEKTAEEYVKHHKGGTVWARGMMLDGVPTGYWEWFRKDGTKLRSGYFENGSRWASGRRTTATARRTR